MTTTWKGNFPERNKFFQTNSAEMRCALRGSVSTCNYSSNCAIVSLDLYVRIKPFFNLYFITDINVKKRISDSSRIYCEILQTFMF